MEPEITIRLFKDNKLKGTTKLTLQDFRSESVNKKCYYEIMAGEKHSCFLRAMVGISLDIPSDVHCANTPLDYYKGVYIPQRDYRSCQALPDEWIENLPNIKRYN